MAAEALAAQANFEAQMKTLYNNPFASQLLAASSKMFSNFDVNPFLQTTFKQEVQDDSYADAEEEGRRKEQEISMERERVEEDKEDKEDKEEMEEVHDRKDEGGLKSIDA